MGIPRRGNPRAGLQSAIMPRGIRNPSHSFDDELSTLCSPASRWCSSATTASTGGAIHSHSFRIKMTEVDPILNEWGGAGGAVSEPTPSAQKRCAGTHHIPQRRGASQRACSPVFGIWGGRQTVDWRCERRVSVLYRQLTSAGRWRVAGIFRYRHRFCETPSFNYDQSNLDSVLLSHKPLPQMLLLRFFIVVSAVTATFEPKVITIEAHPSRKAFGSLSMPEGSPWCNGMPTYWLVGHQSDRETPWCLVRSVGMNTSFANYDYSGARFSRPARAILGTSDALNRIDGPASIDRHGCTSVDVNRDGLVDIVCGVGANKGFGYGYNELYLTAPNGSVSKVLHASGLQQYTTIRTRYLVTLDRADGAKLVFIAARGSLRSDGATNTHRMYRLNSYNSTYFYFTEEVNNIWIQNTIASCLVKADLDNDGLQDLLICNERTPALLFVQHANNSWSALPVLGLQNTSDWSNARVADVTGDGFPDIIVVGRGQPSYLKVFQGSRVYPHYNFSGAPYFEMTLPFAAPDVEVLDVNGDLRPDLYVVQVDETPVDTNYCWNRSSLFQFNGRAPSYFIPPLDRANDILLVAEQYGTFTKHTMNFTEPGCGSRAERFGGGKTMILAQGSEDKDGHNLLLQW